MRCQVKGIGIFTVKSGEKMYNQNFYVGRGGGGAAGLWIGRGETVKDAWSGVVGLEEGSRIFPETWDGWWQKLFLGGTEGVITPALF